MRIVKLTTCAIQSIIASLLQTFLSSPSNISSMYELPTPHQANKTYSLSGTLCIPKNGPKNPDHIQYLVHGIGFDSRCACSKLRFGIMLNMLSATGILRSMVRTTIAMLVLLLMRVIQRFAMIAWALDSLRSRRMDTSTPCFQHE